MKRPEDIISDEEIQRVHANANFGYVSKREVVDKGLLKYAFGYSTGHTLYQILHEHGLIHKLRPHSYRSNLTKKGHEYLRALTGGIDLDRLLRLFEATRNERLAA